MPTMPKKQQPAQTQDKQPGREHLMTPRPKTTDPQYKGAGKLSGKVAIISGGDSGIGRAVAWFFAKEGADIVIMYLDEHKDAQDTIELIENEGRKALAFAGDIGDPSFSEHVVQETLKAFGKISCVVNNAAEQHEQDSLLKITPEQLEKTFRTNIFGYFYLTKAALPHLAAGDTIINTTSVTAYRGSNHLIDYASTKGAIVSFTRSLASSLAEQKIRVNAVAPGPIWTPLIPATFDAERVENFGGNVPLGRAGQPEEVAPSFVFLASDDSSYMTGQVLHPNGGEIING